MEVTLFSSEYKLISYEQLPVHKYFIVDGDPQRKIYLKTQAPGAFLLQVGGCDWIQQVFFNNKPLHQVFVRRASIDIKKAESTQYGWDVAQATPRSW